jgi:hypothetical protein
MAHTRLPAVAGLFYPDDPKELLLTVDTLLDQADIHEASEPAARAIIVPHAGYIYSGPIAATVYRQLRATRQNIKRVAVFGPSHGLAFTGLAVPDCDTFTTPLGEIPVDKEAIELLLQLPQVQRLEQAHSQEHSLEVQLPFLQRVLDDFTLIPVVVGDASTRDVAAAINAIWNDSNTLIVISSDLSHYHDYATAQQMDQRTSRAIETLHDEQIGYEDACGRNPVKGLLEVARQRGLTAHTIDLRNSGDTAGSKDSVVGYGAYVFH